MLSVYLFCVALGGVLILASVLFGDADMEADVDVDVEADMDADLDQEVSLEWSVLPFGSLRFWTFLVECFGLTGALLTLVGIPSAWTVGISLMMGSTMGWLAFQFFRMIAREEVSGDVRLERFGGQEAHCMVAIRGGGKGKIRISSLAEQVDLLAQSSDQRDIERGAKVLVVGIHDGVAEVTSLLPYDESVATGARHRNEALAYTTEA